MANAEEVNNAVGPCPKCGFQARISKASDKQDAILTMTVMVVHLLQHLVAAK